MDDRFQNRLDNLSRAAKKAGADAILVTDFTNVTYLTNFTGDDSFLLVCPGGSVMVSDGRYTTQLGEQCPGLDLHIRHPGVATPQAVA